MKISNNGLNLIKSFEGCRLQAYKCPAGVWTIGWGHTGNVKAGQTISQVQADQLVLSDLTAYEAIVSRYESRYGWNQNEFDALTSFAYNVGNIDQLTAKGTRDRATIAEKILQYNKGGGKVLAGLSRRREAERALFLTPVSAPEGWQQDSYGWWYQQKDGSYPVGCWKELEWNGKKSWYYFNAAGYMVADDWREKNGKWYYLGADGAMVKSCVMLIGKEAFAFGPDGAMLEGEIKLKTNSRGALCL